MADRQPNDDDATATAEERPRFVVLPGGADEDNRDRGADDGDRRRSDEIDPDVRLRHVIGDVLRDERRRQGRTLAEVAEEAAVSLPYLSEVERGRKEISSDLLHAVHDALGLDLHQVLERATRRLELRARPQSGGPMLLAA